MWVFCTPYLITSICPSKTMGGRRSALPLMRTLCNGSFILWDVRNAVSVGLAGRCWRKAMQCRRGGCRCRWWQSHGGVRRAEGFVFHVAFCSTWFASMVNIYKQNGCITAFVPLVQAYGLSPAFCPSHKHSGLSGMDNALFIHQRRFQF